MKKAQIQHMFLYIFILVIVVLIMFFGYRAFRSSSNQVNAAAVLKFQTQLQNDVSSLSVEYGSLTVKNYNTPIVYNEVCLVDLKNANFTEILNRPLIQDSVEAGVQQNVFLLEDDGFESFYIEGMELFGYPYIFCFPSGSVELSIAGTGRYAVIHPPATETHCVNANISGLCDGLDVFFEGYRQDCCDDWYQCCIN